MVKVVKRDKREKWWLRFASSDEFNNGRYHVNCEDSSVEESDTLTIH